MSRLVIVTGGSRGLGRALIHEALGKGDVTASVSRTRGPANEHLEADLAVPGSWPRVIEWMSGVVDAGEWADVCFVHNAATLEPIGFGGETPADAHTRQAFLNLTAPIVLGDGFLRLVRDRRGPSTLVQITSGAATTVYPGWSGYGPAKAAIDHWVRTVGRELDLRQSPARVVAVAPGVVDTGMQQAIRDSQADAFPEVERFRRLHESGQLVSPADAAGRLYRLVTEEHWPNGSVVDLRSLT